MKNHRLILRGTISATILVLGMAGFQFFRQKNFSPKEGFSSFISKTNSQKEATSRRVVSLISPHHLAAQKIIEDVFQQVSENNQGDSIDTVILISPNHKNSGRGWINVSWEKRFWQDEVFEPNEKMLAEISGAGLAVRDDAIFHGEHGIENLLPYVKKYFPRAKLVSVLMRDGCPREKSKELGEKLAAISSEKTLLILSADFSHYIGKTASDFHDQKAVSVLSQMDVEKSSDLDVDCPQGLEALMRYSQLKKGEKFNLSLNSNSSQIYGQDFMTENTSYVSGYYSLGEKSEDESMDLIFVGDAMLDRGIRLAAEKRGVGFLTKKIERLFWSADDVIYNLEGPITSNMSVSRGTTFGEKGHMQFTFNSQDALDFSQNIRSRTVFWGNNHILDFGKAGLLDTEKILSENGLENFGQAKEENKSALREPAGQKIAFVAFNQFLGSFEASKTEIERMKKKADFVVLYAHWGDEYSLWENERQREWGREFVDAGADLVIGTHPHVLEPLEEYKGKMIFYSLGNFIFDQYFSPETMSGLAAGISIREKTVDFYLFPISLIRDGSVELSEVKKRDAVLSWLAENSTASNKLKNDLKNGHFQINR